MLKEKEIYDRMYPAFDNGEFEVHYQPKMDLKSGKISGAEALVRWNDPVRGYVRPDEFIYIFEKTNAIIKLDLFVFEQACILLQKWIDHGQKPVPLSVNLSYNHFKAPNFLDAYKEIFYKYQIPPELIEMELSEKMTFNNKESFKEAIAEMHQIGFLCSLDDFGSNYSSLNVLKGLKVDTIKLDKEFFNDFENYDNRNFLIIEEMIRLAQRLKIKTIAEGVENEEQLRFLRSVSCNEIQGFVYSRPLPMDKFQQFVVDERKRLGE